MAKRITDAEVTEAIRRVERDLRKAREALRWGQPVSCFEALERAQHRAFEAKALFLGDSLPSKEEIDQS